MRARRLTIAAPPAPHAPALAALLLAALALPACATTPRDAAAPPAQEPAVTQTRDAAPAGAFTLRPGERHDIAGAGTLRYERLVNDSRCPPDVQCVWAGDAIVAFSWTPATGAATTFELHTGLEPRSHALGDGRTLVLQALARGDAPAATLRIESGG